MKRLLLFLISIMLSANTLFAIGGGVGTSSFYFLDIGMGGASGAMASANLAYRGTLEGLYNNPASLAALEDDINILAEVNPYAPNEYFTMLLWSGAISYKLLGKVTLGVSVYGLTYGDMITGIEDATSVGETNTPMDIAVSAAAAVAIDDFVDIPVLDIDAGFTFRFAREDLIVDSISAIAFDAGAIVTIEDIIPLSEISVGIEGKNLGFSITDREDGTGVPVSLLAGLGYKLSLSDDKIYVKILADFDININHMGVDATGSPDYEAQLLKVNIGGELGLFNMFAVRGGYIVGEKTGGISGLSFGAGFKYQFIDMITTRVDYAFVSHGELGGQHNIQIGLGFKFKKEEPRAANTNEVRGEVVDTVSSIEQASISSLAVLDLVAENVSEDEMTTISSSFRSWFDTRENYVVIDKMSMMEILKGLSEGACSDPACAVKTGQALGVDYVAYGKVSKTGEGAFSLTVELVDVKTSEVAFKAESEYDSVKDITKSYDDLMKSLDKKDE